MAFGWVLGAFLIASGVILRGIYVDQDSPDPLSPDYKNSEALDELEDELERERRNRWR